MNTLPVHFSGIVKIDTHILSLLLSALFAAPSGGILELESIGLPTCYDDNPLSFGGWGF